MAVELSVGKLGKNKASGFCSFDFSPGLAPLLVLPLVMPNVITDHRPVVRLDMSDCACGWLFCRYEARFFIGGGGICWIIFRSKVFTNSET